MHRQSRSSKVELAAQYIEKLKANGHNIELPHNSCQENVVMGKILKMVIWYANDLRQHAPEIRCCINCEDIDVMHTTLSINSLNHKKY